MATAALPAPAPAENRAAVRLLFAGVIAWVLLMMVLRDIFGEPYPGPFMPGFPGTGLDMISRTEATIVVPQMEVRFTDNTTAPVTQAQIFGHEPGSIQSMLVFHLVANPDAQKLVSESQKPRLRRILDRFFPSMRRDEAPPPFVFPEDGRQYVALRLRQLFPDKTPAMLTITLQRENFPLGDFHHPSSTSVVSRTDIPVHEGS